MMEIANAPSIVPVGGGVGGVGCLVRALLGRRAQVSRDSCAHVLLTGRHGPLRTALAALLLGASVAPVPTLDAQRLPVLRQVKVPHPYYYREMYLPQLTTGPSAAGWSPDGTELVYAMRGSLWRQRVGSDSAVQLTDGPGYDYQPDWSPDGRSVVYVSYIDDALQLRILNLATGESTALLSNGAVNVEPRWSPEGGRIVWVSTAWEGRFHVFVASVTAGALGTPVRVTEDRDSALPRYYYSRFDHYLSPSWSPDGNELIVVSNRGRIWGTGGLWRVPARAAGAPMRELRYEETNWKARPDWARDGKRIVYSSYLGQQWHQLWLLPADGRQGTADGSETTSNAGDAFQLTYGDFDATYARWSPDGRAIAFVSNQGGNTSLWTVTVPGGARRQIIAQTRRWKSPAGSLRLTVVDAATGRLLPARLSARGADGRHYAPDDAWIHADDGFDRRERKFEFAYFHADAASLLVLPAGKVTIEAMRGLEYHPVVLDVTVRAGETTTVRIPLRALSDIATRGWVSGDLHVHMNYGGTYRNTPANLVRQARAENLRVVENLIVNKEGRIPDIGYFTGKPDPASTRDVLLSHDEEFHTSYWGHTAMLGLTSNMILPVYAAYANTAASSLAPLNAEVLRLAREQGAATGYVHPFDVWPEAADTTRPLTNGFPIDVALGQVDYYEALGFVDDFTVTQRVWYAALNCGFRIPAGAGTDAMANYTSLRGPVGMNRVYVKPRPGPLTQKGFLDALKAGRTFVTNAPLLEFSLNRQEAGSNIALPPGANTLTARVRMRSMVAIDHLELVRNGEVVANVPVSADRRAADAVVQLEPTESGWYLLRASSDEARHPVIDLKPFGTTSPIYVTVGGAPIRSAADARYFIAWIDRLRANVRGFTGWNDERERADALGTIEKARAEFERRLAIPIP